MGLLRRYFQDSGSRRGPGHTSPVTRAPRSRWPRCRRRCVPRARRDRPAAAGVRGGRRRPGPVEPAPCSPSTDSTTSPGSRAATRAATRTWLDRVPPPGPRRARRARRGRPAAAGPTPGRSPAPTGGNGPGSTGAAGCRTPGRAGHRARPRCHRPPRRPPSAPGARRRESRAATVFSGCSSGSTVPRSGQVPTTTWQPVARSVPDRPRQVAGGLLDGYPVGDVVRPDHDHRQVERPDGRPGHLGVQVGALGAHLGHHLDKDATAGLTGEPAGQLACRSLFRHLCAQPGGARVAEDREPQRRRPGPSRPPGPGRGRRLGARLADRPAGPAGLGPDHAPRPVAERARRREDAPAVRRTGPGQPDQTVRTSVGPAPSR